MFIQCDGVTKNKKRCENNSKFVTEHNQHYCGIHVKSDKTCRENRLECIVCYNDVPVKKAVKTVCQHVFCNACLTKWLRRNHTCPLCRATLREPDEESELTDEDIETMANQFITELVQNNQIAFMDNNLYITIELTADQLPLLEQWNNHVVTIEHLVHLLP